MHVGAIVCASGDVLLKIERTKSPAMFRWVGLKTFSQPIAFNEIFHFAYADTGPACNDNAGKLLCQNRVAPGELLRRVSVPGKGCHDETVDTYTGAVVKRRVPCDLTCN